jgi:predicted nucleic-acid-binding protein
MKSLDTNVLARFFIDDPDDAQALRQRPAAVVAMSEPAYVTATVLLEFEWVMRGFYELPRADIERVLRALLGIGHVIVEDRYAMLDALDYFGAGMDFADAVHLTRSQRVAAFVTFDRRLARRAAALGCATPVERLG